MSRKPVPFRQFVLKVHSRCDLACDHCYIYEQADQSWRGRPREIDAKTAAQAAVRIAEHAAAHGLPEVRIVLHGGEPLLLGLERMREVLAALETTISPVARLDLRIHTNAVLLDEGFLDLFAEHGVKVGVSLDGDRAANDRHRLYRDGRSSYDQVLAALERLRAPTRRALYAGLLCTIDIANDPVAVYRGLLAQQPPRIDLLLPHSTWETQPVGLAHPRDPSDPGRGDAEYGRWLGAVFDVWDAEGRPVPIRTFESVLGALYGRPTGTEALGLDPVDLLVIETDGTLEQVDSLKTAYDGAAATGLDVWRNSLDDAAAVPGIAVRQQGIDGVSATCQACELVRVCGGGLYPHRYRPENGFDNPSVYCADLKAMITHVIEVEDGHGRGVRVKAEARRSSTPDDSYDGLDLREEDLAGLVAGYGSAEAVHVLMRNQAALQRDLLALVARRGPQQDRRFGESWDLLASLSASAPDAVTTVLAHPYTRAWAVRLLTSRRTGDPSDDDVHHLEALATSAAVHAGLKLRLPVPVRGETAPLPTFGGLSPGVGDRVWCDTGSVAGLDLREPLRRIDAAGLTITVEDTDPYRVCHGDPAERLGPEEADRWARALPTAIAFVDEHLPEFARALRAGLTTIVPLLRPGDGADRSSAARHAVGSVGIALPDDPARLALLLVHEFQHVKLGALLDIAELFDPSATEPRHYAPWRPDPRPIEGLLQGVYAHLAVVAFWRVRHGQLVGAEREAAQARFAQWRVHTADAVRELQESGSLTALGERLVRGVGETLEPWLGEPVSRSAQTTALRRAADLRAQYEARMRGIVRASQHS